MSRRTWMEDITLRLLLETKKTRKIDIVQAENSKKLLVEILAPYVTILVKNG
jgi:hypothetical protein